MIPESVAAMTSSKVSRRDSVFRRTVVILPASACFWRVRGAPFFYGAPCFLTLSLPWLCPIKS
jgi:hypothetical protein